MVQDLSYLKESASQTAGPYVHIGLTPNFAEIKGVYPTDLGTSMVNDKTRGERITVTGRVIDGFDVMPPGGLYVVTGKGRMDVVVVSLPNQQRGGDIAIQIGFSPALDQYAASASSIDEDIQLLTLWSKARVVGPLGIARHGKIVRTMRDALAKLVCGVRWMRAEAAFEGSDKGADAIADLGEFVSADQARHSFAAKLRLSRQEAAEMTPAEVVAWLLPIASAFGICGDRNVVEKALRYLTDPVGFVVSSANAAKDVQDLALQGDLLRGVRYLQILLEDRSWDWA